MKRTAVAGVVVLSLAIGGMPGRAAVVIRELNNRTGWRLENGKNIVIFAGNGNPDWQFESYEYVGNPPERKPADIGTISIDEHGGVGPIRLSIPWIHASRSANNVAGIDLMSHAGAEDHNSIDVLQIEGTLGPVHVWRAGTLEFTTLEEQKLIEVEEDLDELDVNGLLAGAVRVPGALRGGAFGALGCISGNGQIDVGILGEWDGVSAPAGPTFGRLQGTVTVRNTLHFANIKGGVAAGSAPGGAGRGRIELPGGTAGTLWVTRAPNWDGAMNGTITVAGDFRGRIETCDGMGGELIVHGDLRDGAALWIGGHGPAGGGACEPLEPAHLTGTVTVEGHMLGASIGARGRLLSSGPGSGHIIINGAFGRSAHEIAVINLFGGLEGAQAFIATNCGGSWSEPAGPWGPGSHVTLDGSAWREYRGNTPAQHIWRISHCPGDMDNNQVIDFADIDPFLLALNRPDDYARTYPGLASSRVLRGDTNCDGRFTQADWEPLLEAVAAQCSAPRCPCVTGSMSPSVKPSQWPGEFRAHVAQEHQDEVRGTVKQLAKDAKDDRWRPYWEDVAEALQN